MENLFKYIKVSDINPSLKIYHSDPETDAEESRLLSDDELISTEDEQEESHGQYEQIRRRFILSQLKVNKFQNENTRLQSKLMETEQIVITIKNEMEDLDFENEELEQELKKILEELKINKEKVKKNNNKIIYAGIIGFIGGVIVTYITKIN